MSRLSLFLDLWSFAQCLNSDASLYPHDTEVGRKNNNLIDVRRKKIKSQDAATSRIRGRCVRRRRGGPDRDGRPQGLFLRDRPRKVSKRRPFLPFFSALLPARLRFSRFSDRFLTIFLSCSRFYCPFEKPRFDVDSADSLCAAKFEDNLDTTGWGVLNVVAGKAQENGALASSVQKFDACGALEGFLTRERILQQYKNMEGFFFPPGKTPPAKLYEFLAEQEKWTKQQISVHAEKSGFWGGVALIDAQFEGLFRGYNWDLPKQSNFTHLPRFAFQLLNGVGDFLDLLAAISEDFRPDFDKMSEMEIKRYVGTHGMCSAMIKVNGDLSEMWNAHSVS
jgi:Phospholipase B